MRRRALRKNMHNMFGLGRKMRCPRQERCRRGVRRAGLVEQQTFAEKSGQTQRAKSHSSAIEKLTTGQKMIFQPGGVFPRVVVVVVHKYANILFLDDAAATKVSAI